MSDLFKNVNFTLTTNSKDVPSSTRNSGHHIYTPTKVIGHTETGSVVLYDQNSFTRGISYDEGVLELGIPIFKFSQDFAGMDFFNNKAGRLFWKTCDYDISMDGVFTFDFGETLQDGRIVGFPKKFSAELVGNYGGNFVLRYELDDTYYQTEEKIMDESILYKTFIFYPNGIPVPVTVDAHLGRRSEFHAESRNIEMEVGCSMSGEARFGVLYDSGSFTSIQSYSPVFEMAPTVFNIYGSVDGKLSFFPSINIKFFNFFGPIFDPMPYIKEKLVVDGSLEEEHAQYYSLLGSGLDLRLGLNMDFLSFGNKQWKSDLINLLKQPLSVTPARLVGLSPANGTPTKPFAVHDVQIRVESYNYLTRDFYPCPFAWVDTFLDDIWKIKVSDTNGLINTQGITDNSGYFIRGADLKFTHTQDDKGNYYILWDGNTHLDIFDEEW